MNITSIRNMYRILIALLAVSFCITLTACEDDDDEFDHDIPAGQGTLVVNNTTGNDIEVYISGIRNKDADHNDYEFYDRDPGAYRVVLEEDDGDRSWFGEIDVLEGRKTIMDVYTSSYKYNYDVYLRID